MARNGSGTMILTTGNPVVTGTVIQSATFNTTLTDVANEITNSLPRDGQAPMTAPLKIIDGTVTIPGLSFNSDSATGIWRPSAGVMSTTVSGVEVLRLTNAGNVGIGRTPTVRLDIGTTTDTTNGTTVHASGSGRAFHSVDSNGSAAMELVANFSGSADTYGIPSGVVGLGGLGAVPMVFGTNGAERMRIDSSGNAYIATTTSIARLSVAATGALPGVGISGNSTSIATSDLYIARTGATESTLVGQGTSIQFQNTTNSTAVLIQQAANALQFFNFTGATWTERMRLDASGNLGIGKTPSYKLDVSSGAHAQAFTANGTPDAFESAGGTVIGYNGSGVGVLRSYANSSGTGTSSLLFEIGSTTAATIDSSGQLGIGGTPSAAYLDIFGNTSAYPITQAMLRINNSSATGQSVIDFKTNSTFRGRFRSDYAGNMTYVASGGSHNFFVGGDTGTGSQAFVVSSAGLVQDGAGNELGFKGLPSASVTSGAFTAADRGKCIFAGGGVTVPNSTMAANDVVVIQNTTASPITITASIATLRWTGTTNTGNRTLGVFGRCSIVFTSGTVAYISGDLT